MGTYTTPEAFVFNDSNNALTTAALMNGGGFGGGMMNNPFWAIILLAFLRQWGWDGNGNGNGCGCLTQNQLSSIQNTLNTNQGQTLLMNAITGNGTGIKELASALNCNQNAVTAAINGIQAAIANVSNQNNMNAMQVVNSIQSGNTALANQLSQCCCDMKTETLKANYENQINNLNQSQLIQNGFCQVGYEAAQNANGIRQAISDQTIAINGKLDAMDKDRLQRENNALTAQVATLTARAERQAEFTSYVTPLAKAIEEIKGKLPSTATVQYPNLVGIPAWQLYGGYPYANGGNFG